MKNSTVEVQGVVVVEVQGVAAVEVQPIAATSKEVQKLVQDANELERMISNYVQEA